MPIFEYICSACSHRFETLVHASTVPRCPACHGEKLEKQLSVFAVAAKGSAAPPGPAARACGTCGDPRGPGSCSIN